MVEDNLRWKTTFSGRRPSVGDDLWWILSYCLVRFAAFLLRDAFKKTKNYVDRETVPKEGRGVAPFPYKNHS